MDRQRRQADSFRLSVDEIGELYEAHSAEMFAEGSWHQKWRFKYKPEAIARFFQERFKDEAGAASLGTDKLKKLLLIVMRNGSTGGSWPLTKPRSGKCYPVRVICRITSGRLFCLLVIVRGSCGR